jgi:hypothetical protein
MKLQRLNTFASNHDGKTYGCLLSETELRLRALELSLGQLIARTKIDGFWADGFSVVARFLEAAPLVYSDFNSAKRHLQNAFVYSQLKEPGAAVFELRIVRGILQRL